MEYPSVENVNADRRAAKNAISAILKQHQGTEFAHRLAGVMIYLNLHFIESCVGKGMSVYEVKDQYFDLLNKNFNDNFPKESV